MKFNQKNFFLKSMIILISIVLFNLSCSHMPLILKTADYIIRIIEMYPYLKPIPKKIFGKKYDGFYCDFDNGYSGCGFIKWGDESVMHIDNRLPYLKISTDKIVYEKKYENDKDHHPLENSPGVLLKLSNDMAGKSGIFTAKIKGNISEQMNDSRYGRSGAKIHVWSSERDQPNPNEDPIYYSNSISISESDDYLNEWKRGCQYFNIPKGSKNIQLKIVFQAAKGEFEVKDLSMIFGATIKDCDYYTKKDQVSSLRSQLE